MKQFTSKDFENLTFDQKLEIIAFLEAEINLCCLNCRHYDFEDSSEQICDNINNHQMIDDNEFNEKRVYKMMVTPDFCCNEWEKAL